MNNRYSEMFRMDTNFKVLILFSWLLLYRCFAFNKKMCPIAVLLWYLFDNLKKDHVDDLYVIFKFFRTIFNKSRFYDNTEVLHSFIHYRNGRHGIITNESLKATVLLKKPIIENSKLSNDSIYFYRMYITT